MLLAVKAVRKADKGRNGDYILKWIKCKDATPETCRRCLVYIDDTEEQYYTIGFYERTGRYKGWYVFYRAGVFKGICDEFVIAWRQFPRFRNGGE